MSAFPTEFFRELVAELSDTPCENVTWLVQPESVAGPRDGRMHGQIVIAYVSRALADYGAEYIDTFNPTGGDDGNGAIETRQKATYITTLTVTAETIGAAETEWAEDTLERLRFRLEHLKNKTRLREQGLVLISQDILQSVSGITEDNRASTRAIIEMSFRQAIQIGDLSCGDYLAISHITETTDQIDSAEPLTYDRPPTPLRVVYCTPTLLDPRGGEITVYGVAMAGSTWSFDGVPATLLQDGNLSVRLLLPARSSGTHDLVATRASETQTLANAVEYWTPSDVPGTALFEAGVGHTYGPVKTQWQTTLPAKRTQFPYIGRDGASCHKIGDEFIMVAGWNPSIQFSGRDTTNEVWVTKDFVNWTLRLPDNHTQFERRHTHGAQTMAGEIILVGGDHFTGAYQRDVVYSADAGRTWQTRLAVTPWSPRMLGVTGQFQGDLYHFGGQTGFMSDFNTAVKHNDLWKSSDRGATWIQIHGDVAPSTTQPSPRGTVTQLVEFLGRLWLVGGAVYNTGNLPAEYFQECWSYHPNDGWRKEADPPWGGTRYNAAFVCDGALVKAFGGRLGNELEWWHTRDGVSWFKFEQPLSVFSPEPMIVGSHADAICVDGRDVYMPSGNWTINNYSMQVRKFTAYTGPEVLTWQSTGNVIDTAIATSPATNFNGVGCALNADGALYFDAVATAYAASNRVINPTGRTVLWAAKIPWFDMTLTFPGAPVSPNESVVGDDSGSQFNAAGMDLNKVAYTEGSGTWQKVNSAPVLSDPLGTFSTHGATHAVSGEIILYSGGIRITSGVTHGYSTANTAWRNIGAGLSSSRAQGCFSAIVIADGVWSDAEILKFQQWSARFQP